MREYDLCEGVCREAAGQQLGGNIEILNSATPKKWEDKMTLITDMATCLVFLPSGSKQHEVLLFGSI